MDTDSIPLLQQQTTHWQSLLFRQHDSSSSAGVVPAQHGRLCYECLAIGWVSVAGMASRAQSAFWECGLACAALANLIFSLSALFIKLTGGRVPVLEVCIVRSAISFVFSMAVLLAKGVTPLFGHRHNLNLLALRGVSGTLSMATYYCSLFLLPLGDAVTINQLKPPVTAVVAYLLLNEPLGVQGILGCVISVAGVVVLAHPPFLFGGQGSWGSARTVGTLFGLASPIFAAGVSYATRRIGKSEPAVVVALWFHLCTLVMLSGPLALRFPQRAVLPSGKDAALLVGIAATSFCAQVLQTRGLQLVVAAKASAMSFTQVIYGNMLGACLFGERITTLGMVGTAFILLGVLVVTIRPDRKQKQPAPAAAADSATVAPADSSQEGSLSGEHAAEGAETPAPLQEALEAKLLLVHEGRGEGELGSGQLPESPMSGTIGVARQQSNGNELDDAASTEGHDEGPLHMHARLQ